MHHLVILTLLLALSLASLSFQANTGQDSLLQARMQVNSYLFERQLDQDMQIHKLQSSNNVTCNDGSPISYYRRLNSHSRSWVIYLQGGGICTSRASCRQRWRQNPHLMSSNNWPQTKSVDGILSSKPTDNPYLWNANHIFIPYCSSDSWTGLRAASVSEDQPFSFMGSKIIELVLDSLYDELPRESSLHEAQYVLLAGDSAGATGVILNLDNVDAIIKRRAAEHNRTKCIQNSACVRQAPTLRGLADSGWFLDNEPYAAGEPSGSAREPDLRLDVDCDSERCSPVQYINHAMRYWNGQVPASCASQHPKEPWLCYFGYRTYATLKAPLFVVQWLYDEAQLIVDNIARPDTSGQWSYVNKVVNEMRTSLENVTALFAPSCFSHGLIMKKAWNQINIDGYKLPHILNSWEEQSLSQSGALIEPLSSDKEAQVIRLESSPPASFSAPAASDLTELSGIQFGQPLQLLLGAGSVSSSEPPVEPETPNQPRNFAQQNHIRRATHPNRSRTRKRKRNNQQQRSRSLNQQRSRANPEPQDPTSSLAGLPRVPNQTIAPTTTPTTTTTASLLNLMPDRKPKSSIDRNSVTSEHPSQTTDHAVAQGRLGRSTLIDDSSWLASNNVPEDHTQGLSIDRVPKVQPTDQSQPPLSLSTYGFTLLREHKSTASNRFRLIDDCGWPQCNRDCPMKLETDFSLTSTSSA